MISVHTGEWVSELWWLLKSSFDIFSFWCLKTFIVSPVSSLAGCFPMSKESINLSSDLTSSSLDHSFVFWGWSVSTLENFIKSIFKLLAKVLSLSVGGSSGGSSSSVLTIWGVESSSHGLSSFKFIFTCLDNIGIVEGSFPGFTSGFNIVVISMSIVNQLTEMLPVSLVHISVCWGIKSFSPEFVSLSSQSLSFW